MVWDGSLEIIKRLFGGFFALKVIISKAWCTLGLCPQTENLKYSWLQELNPSGGWEPQLQGSSQGSEFSVLPRRKTECLKLSIHEEAEPKPQVLPSKAGGLCTLLVLDQECAQLPEIGDISQHRQGLGIGPKPVCVGRVKTTWAEKPLQLSHKPALLDKLSKIVLSAQQAHDLLHKGVLLEIPWIPPLSQGLSTEPHISRPLPPVISFFTVIMEYFDGDDCLKASTSLLMWLEDLTPFHSLVAPAITLIYFR